MERKAWEKVLRKSRADNLSLCQTVIALLNETEAPGLSLSQQEAVASQITGGVMDELKKVLPPFIAGCVAGSRSAASANNVPSPAAPSHENSPAEPNVPDFRRSRVNRSFAGG